MHDDGHDRRLSFDLETLARRFTSRRQVLKMLGAATLLPLVSCGDASDSGGVDAGGGDGSDAGGGGGTCDPIPEETGGPYPGDGSNGPDALALDGIVRSDIRSSIGSASGVAEGVLLTVTLNLTGTGSGCSPLAGAAVYLWHCDRAGDYSMYTGDARGENYLRGVQVADADGVVTFTTIFPACYSGRWPHIHFEVYPGLDDATSGSNLLRTSQLALPEDACDEVFATDGYEQSVQNLSATSLESDMVFRDGVDLQLASVTGGVADGYLASLTVAVAA